MAIDFDAPQLANTFAAGPTGGGSAVPTMRAIVWADFDAALRAALLASINCEQAGQTSQWLEFALSDQGADAVPITTSDRRFTDRPPAFEFVEEEDAIRISCTTAPSDGPIIVDVKFGTTGGSGGSSIFSTLIQIDDGELTSVTSSVPYVLSTTTHSDDAEMSVFIDTLDGDMEVTGLLIRMHVRWL